MRTKVHQRAFGGPLDLAFIDGLHLFEQVVRDFINVERNASPRTVVLLHDSLPLDEVTAGRERVTDFYSGDVWKAVLAIRRLRPELRDGDGPRRAHRAHAGEGPRPGSSTVLEDRFDEVVREYLGQSFSYLGEHKAEMPGQIPNDEEAVRDWLARSHAQVS